MCRSIHDCTKIKYVVSFGNNKCNAVRFQYDTSPESIHHSCYINTKIV